MGKGTIRRLPPPPRICLAVLGDPTMLIAPVEPRTNRPRAAVGHSDFYILLPQYLPAFPLPLLPLPVSGTAPWFSLPPGGRPTILPGSASHGNFGGQRPTVMLPHSV